MCRGLTQQAYGYMRLSMPPRDRPHVGVFQPRAAGTRQGRQRRCCWVGFGDRAHHSDFQQSRVHGHDCRSVKLSITSLFPDSASREGGFPAASVHMQSCRSLRSALHICWSANICGNELKRTESWLKGCWCLQTWISLQCCSRGLCT